MRRPVVWIEVGKADKAQDLAVAGIHQDGNRALGIHDLHPAFEHVFDCCLNGQVQRQGQWHVAATGITQFIVHGFLDASDSDEFGCAHSFTTKADPAQHMRGKPPVGIEPHLPWPEQEARLTNVLDRVPLLGTDPAPDPEELSRSGESLIQALFIEIGKNLCQFPRGDVRIDQVLRLGVDGVRRQVGRKNSSVPVGNVRARSNDLGAARRGLRLDRFRRGHDRHFRADCCECGKEHERQRQQAALHAFALTVTASLVARGKIGALDFVRVLARLARGKDPGQWAKRNSGHSSPPSSAAARSGCSG